MAKGNGNGKKKIGGKLGPRAGERDKGGKKQLSKTYAQRLQEEKQRLRREAEAKRRAKRLAKSGATIKSPGRDMPLPKSGKFKGWE